MVPPEEAAAALPLKLIVTMAEPPTAVELPRMVTVTALAAVAMDALDTLPPTAGRQSLETVATKELFDWNDSDRQVRALLADNINSETRARTV